MAELPWQLDPVVRAMLGRPPADAPAAPPADAGASVPPSSPESARPLATFDRSVSIAASGAGPIALGWLDGELDPLPALAALDGVVELDDLDALAPLDAFAPVDALVAPPPLAVRAGWDEPVGASAATAPRGVPRAEHEGSWAAVPPDGVAAADPLRADAPLDRVSPGDPSTPVDGGLGMPDETAPVPFHDGEPSSPAPADVSVAGVDEVAHRPVAPVAAMTGLAPSWEPPESWARVVPEPPAAEAAASRHVFAAPDLRADPDPEWPPAGFRLEPNDAGRAAAMSGDATAGRAARTSVESSMSDPTMPWATPPEWIVGDDEPPAAPRHAAPGAPGTPTVHAVPAPSPTSSPSFAHLPPLPPLPGEPELPAHLGTHRPEHLAPGGTLPFGPAPDPSQRVDPALLGAPRSLSLPAPAPVHPGAPDPDLRADDPFVPRGGSAPTRQRPPTHRPSAPLPATSGPGTVAPSPAPTLAPTPPPPPPVPPAAALPSFAPGPLRQVPAAAEGEAREHQALLAASGVTKTYHSGPEPVTALRGIDLTVDAGEYLVVTGPSGSGKTTLLRCLSGLDEIDGGEVVVAGEVLHALNETERARHRSASMGFVFQSFNLIPVFTAVENVELPLLMNGWTRRDARRDALALLERVGLGARAGFRPVDLSGGEQQRVAVARALVGSPAVVWADEPTGSLDSQAAEQVLTLLGELHASGTTVVLVTHDESVAAAAPRRVVMRDGRITSDERRARLGGRSAR